MNGTDQNQKASDPWSMLNMVNVETKIYNSTNLKEMTQNDKTTDD